MLPMRAAAEKRTLPVWRRSSAQYGHLLPGDLAAYHWGSPSVWSPSSLVAACSSRPYFRRIPECPRARFRGR
jgi:hypothetical protein